MDLYFPQASVMPLPSYFLTSTPFIELVFLFKGPPPSFEVASPASIQPYLFTSLLSRGHIGKWVRRAYHFHHGGFN